MTQEDLDSLNPNEFENQVVTSWKTKSYFVIFPALTSVNQFQNDPNMPEIRRTHWHARIYELCYQEEKTYPEVVDELKDYPEVFITKPYFYAIPQWEEVVGNH